MSNISSEFGADKLEQAYVSEVRALNEALDRELAPIEYEVLFIENGEERYETFSCKSNQRAEYMHTKFGIDLDNDPFALRNKGTDGRWKKPIGNEALCEKLVAKH